MSAARILAAYRAIFGTLIAVASIQPLVAAPAHHVALLAAVEIAGALMLMWRRTQWVGASVLLAVFACAQVLSAVEGEYPTRFPAIRRQRAPHRAPRSHALAGGHSSIILKVDMTQDISRTEPWGKI